MYHLRCIFNFFYYFCSIKLFLLTSLSREFVPAKSLCTRFTSIFLKHIWILLFNASKSFAFHPFLYTSPFKIDQKSSIGLTSGMLAGFSDFDKFDFLLSVVVYNFFCIMRACKIRPKLIIIIWMVLTYVKCIVAVNSWE